MLQLKIHVKEQSGVMKVNIFTFLGCCLLLLGCSDDKSIDVSNNNTQASVKESPKQKLVETPKFDANRAFEFVQAQVNFGPRVPNTKEHVACGNYLTNKLKEFGLDTVVQAGEVLAYNKKKLAFKNIIGRYKPENANRIMLYAHWDTRPYADRDTEKRTKPIDGANDGASGVGVLLEIARSINSAEIKPDVGIDIIFFDVEDYGQPEGTMLQNDGNSWCLGSQYFANNLPFANYRPKYGILLDMVGAGNAVFPKEGVSLYYAPQVVNNVWRVANELGYGNYFTDGVITGGLTDDHTYINQIAKIPSIDIIHYEVNRRDFGEFHHTHNDNMSIIDKETLKAVGETVLQVIYQEQ
jgi:glutaminyl-peptide cyclotransferase